MVIMEEWKVVSSDGRCFRVCPIECQSSGTQTTCIGNDNVSKQFLLFIFEVRRGP